MRPTSHRPCLAWRVPRREAWPPAQSKESADMQDLDGKIAFVTGGSSGIGLGLVKVLAAAGMKVAFTYRQAPHRDEALDYFRQHGGQRVHAIALDVTDRPGFAAAADEAEQVLGG